MIKQLLFSCLAVLSCVCMYAQSPTVDYNVDEVGTDFITISFTPNADVAGYAVCLFEAGTAEQQFAMFGPWMGFQTMGDMIRGWGLTYTEAAQYTWTRQNPGTAYEIYVQCWDADNVDADMIIIPVTTNKLGGEGLAEMTIEIGEFGGDEEYGYYQCVIYTPNENVSVHRDMIITREAYETEEWGEENILNYLKADNPYDPYWNQYGVDNAQWNAEMGTAYIAFSIGKNALDEWGPLAMVEFTTPGGSTTGVIEVNASKTQYLIGAGHISANGMKAGGEVNVYDMNGRLVAKARANASGTAEVAIDGIERGIYIVTDGQTTRKFMK